MVCGRRNLMNLYGYQWNVYEIIVKGNEMMGTEFGLYSSGSGNIKADSE